MRTGGSGSVSVIWGRSARMLAGKVVTTKGVHVLAREGGETTCERVCSVLLWVLLYGGSFRLSWGVDVDAPLRWFRCIRCGWSELCLAGSGPYICDLCMRKRKSEEETASSQSA